MNIDEEEEIRRSSWVEVVRNLKKEKKKKKLKRPWNSLPSLALLSIFCKSELKDRIQSIPLVCKSWKYVSDDPRCWTSMIPDSVSPDSVSPEDAFIKNTSGYEFQSNKLSQSFESKYYQQQYKRISIKEEEVPVLVTVGLSRLQTLLKKSGGGAVITTLYLSPFTPFRLSHFNGQCGEILHLIANCCPNLKHISLEAPCLSYTEALLQLFNRCKKLELVDLSYTRDADVDDAPLLLQELGKCLPNLRGIRIKRVQQCYHQDIPIVASIAPYLPRLKLLSFDSTELNSNKLLKILFSSMQLQYLYVKGNQNLYYNQDVIDQASAQIPQFFYQRHDYERERDDHFCSYCCFDRRERREWWKTTENILNHCIEDQYSIDSHIHDDFRIADYRDNLKQRKEKMKMKKKPV